MNIIKTDIEGLVVIEPRIFKDNRGFFVERYNNKTFKQLGINIDFIQDNHSYSHAGVIRGLHYQKEPKAQTKLVGCISGKIFDVAVDIRENSPTFGKWFGIELSAENGKMLLVPKGFAHGFSVLSDDANVLYKVDEFYYPEYDSGIIYNDKTLNIDWHIPLDKAIISEKDRLLKSFL